MITTLFAMMLAGAAQQLPASTSIEVTAPAPSGALKGTLMESGKRGEPVILIVPG